MWKKFLPDRESNPGLPRDRRRSSPLDYRGLVKAPAAKKTTRWIIPLITGPTSGDHVLANKSQAGHMTSILVLIGQLSVIPSHQWKMAGKRKATLETSILLICRRGQCLMNFHTFSWGGEIKFWNSNNVSVFLLPVKEFWKMKKMHRPGIEPGPPAWQASILPLNQRCWHVHQGSFNSLLISIKSNLWEKKVLFRSR